MNGVRGHEDDSNSQFFIILLIGPSLLNNSLFLASNLCIICRECNFLISKFKMLILTNYI